MERQAQSESMACLGINFPELLSCDLDFQGQLSLEGSLLCGDGVGFPVSLNVSDMTDSIEIFAFVYPFTCSFIQ